jgi:glycosyltransferase involved in cell wall biosynthesis
MQHLLEIETAPRRLVLDVSSLARWCGPPVGIRRVESELARVILQSGVGEIAFWDRAHRGFRRLSSKWAPFVLDWNARIDTFDVDFVSRRKGIFQRIPGRQPIVMALERRRLTTGSALEAYVADRLQRIILAPRRHGFPLDDAQGRRIATVPYDLAVDNEIVLGKTDTLLLAGSDWYDKDPDALAEAKAKKGFRLAVVCYDLIPLLFPEFFPDADVVLFRKYWGRMLPLADLLIFNSRCVEADAYKIANSFGVSLKATAVAPLGFSMPREAEPLRNLPADLSPGCYALFVSTIEPRKGHALLLRAWQRLLACHIPQRRSFRLVFVGRPGWLVDDLHRDIAAAEENGSVVWLKNIDDDTLDGLYRSAAFCLYPSLYEGFGLPIIEAFARGKAVIASNGGALPETMQDMGPCLDPVDEISWVDALAQWISDPAIVANCESRVRQNFRYATWPESADKIFKLATGDEAPSVLTFYDRTPQ